MIIPIGHDNSQVRRQPWVTWALIALCTLAFLFTDTKAQFELEGRGDFLEQAADYFRQHAYLEAEKPVLDVVRYDVMPNQRSQYVEALREIARTGMPESDEVLAAEQAELDRLTDLALGRSQPTAAASETNPYRRFGLTPERVTLFTLIAHIFMHAGWLHLLSNMFLLFIMGPALEDRWGRPLYAASYLAAGVFAGSFHAALTHDPSVPLVGASGAIAGVLGAFMVRFWSGQMRFAYFFFIGFRFLRGTFEAPAWAMLGLWFASELFNAWFWHSAGVSTGVAYWAHVGGFALGTAVALGVRTARIEERFVHHKIEARVTVHEGNPAVDAALAARQEGDIEAAFSMLQEEVERNPGDVDAVAAFWDTAVAQQLPEAAAGAVAESLKALCAEGEVELAARQWVELTNLVPAQLAEPAVLLRISAELAERGERETAVRALRHAVDPANRTLTPGMALRVMDAARELDPASALAAARVALSHPDLADAKRERLEGRVAELEAGGVTPPEPVRVEERRRSEPAWAADGAIDLGPDPDPGSEWPQTGDEWSSAPAPLEAAEPPPVPVSAVEGLEPPPVPAVPAPPPGADPEPVFEDEGLEAAIDLPRFSELKSIEAVPLALEDDALCLGTPPKGRARLPYQRIQALGVAAVRVPGEKPVLVIDLLLNWCSVGEQTLCAVRLRSDGFRARSLAPGAESTADALRWLCAQLLERSGAVALPSAEAARGRPFATHPGIESYQREVLEIEC